MALNLNTNQTEIRDTHKSKQKYENWKTGGQKINTDTKNACIILDFINDMEEGRNSDNQHKGSRSFIRLNTLRVRIPQLSRWFLTYQKKHLDELTTDDVTSLFNKLEKGIIKREDGKTYQSVGDYVKDLKSFWHWHQKSQKRLYEKTNGKQGTILPDVCEDISEGKKKPPKFVYFTIDDLQKMLNRATFKYKVLMMFLFDSGVRAPSELLNIKLSDLTYDDKGGFYWLQIRDEATKTFGRRFKLLLSSQLLKQYIERGKEARRPNQNKTSHDFEPFKPDDFIFSGHPNKLNDTLKKIGRETIKKEPTLYDFRHCSVCYWLQRYKNTRGAQFRFGHTTEKMLNYYSQWLGHKDDIGFDDLDTAETRSELQKELEIEKKKTAVLEEQQRFFAQELAELKEQEKQIENPLSVILEAMKEPTIREKFLKQLRETL